VLLCEDESVLGGPFAVAAFVEGDVIRSLTDLDAVDDDGLHQLTEALVATLATLHRVDHVAVGLEGLGRPDGYSERQLKRWIGQWDTVGIPALTAVANELAGRLSADVPAQTRTGIVHGDFRIDNVLLDLSTTAPAVEAVVDWELCTIGDPAADVAMMCAYRNPAFDRVVGGPSAWTSARLPDAQELAGAYERAAGVTLANWSFQIALAHFKVAVIAAGIDYRYRMCSGAGPGFDSAGEAVEPYLHAGLVALQEES
jgi:aminoglycoside phosphotransferase (APT) family kinase protein